MGGGRKPGGGPLVGGAPRRGAPPAAGAEPAGRHRNLLKGGTTTIAGGQQSLLEAGARVSSEGAAATTQQPASQMPTDEQVRDVRSVGLAAGRAIRFSPHADNRQAGAPEKAAAEGCSAQRAIPPGGGRITGAPCICGRGSIIPGDGPPTPAIVPDRPCSSQRVSFRQGQRVMFWWEVITRTPLRHPVWGPSMVFSSAWRAMVASPSADCL